MLTFQLNIYILWYFPTKANISENTRLNWNLWWSKWVFIKLIIAFCSDSLNDGYFLETLFLVTCGKTKGRTQYAEYYQFVQNKNSIPVLEKHPPWRPASLVITSDSLVHRDCPTPSSGPDSIEACSYGRGLNTSVDGWKAQGLLIKSEVPVLIHCWLR